MKTFIVLLVLLFSCSLVYADYATLAGVSWTPVTKAFSGTDKASGTIVWAPKRGSRIALLGMMGTFSGPVTNTTTGVLVKGINATTGLGKSVDVIPFVNIASGPIIITSSVPIWQGEVDETLAATTSGRVTAAIVLWGYEN